VADARGGDDGWIEEARVDAHAIERGIDRRPMGRAPTGRAVMEVEGLVAPAIRRSAAGDPHVARREVAPQPTGAAANRAIARGQLRRSARDLDRDRTAMTGSADHGDRIRHSLLGHLAVLASAAARPRARSVVLPMPK